MKRYALVAVSLMSPVTVISAQQAAVSKTGSPAPSPSAVVPAAAAAPASSPSNGPDANGRYMVRDGDDISLRFAQDISSKTAADGDSVMFTLDDDLKVNGVVVAKAGSKAVGEVTHAEKSGMMGKAGALDLRMDYLKVGDTKVHLRGNKGKEGESGTTGAVVLTVLFGPIGLIKHGKNIDIKAGTPLKAYVSDDIALPPAGS